jgi:endonuclease/exonuclease/phosphatase family metal-dependent hydrolase
VRGEPPIGPDEGRPHVSFKDASTVIGRVAFVSGPVVSVEQRGRVTLLMFGGETDFKAVVYEQFRERFPQALDAAYAGKIVRVRGLVDTHREIPQIVVSDPAQIEVLNEMPPSRPPAPAARPARDHVIVAAYNVLNLFDDVDDPYHQDESTPAKPREELEKLAAMLREIDADVIAFEEVENRSYLERFLEVFVPEMGYAHVVHFEGNDLRGIDVCLASRLPVGTVTSHRHRSFPGVSGEPRRFERDLLCVTIEPPSCKAFEVWVVHLKSNFGGRDAAEPIRLTEANALRHILDERLKAEPQARVILCGDFNDTWDSATMKTIVGEGATAMRCFASELPAETHVTYNREPYRTMIDFLLFSPAMAESYREKSYRIHAGQTASAASDHNAVSASIECR